MLLMPPCLLAQSEWHHPSWKSLEVTLAILKIPSQRRSVSTLKVSAIAGYRGPRRGILLGQPAGNPAPNSIISTQYASFAPGRYGSKNHPLGGPWLVMLLFPHGSTGTEHRMRHHLYVDGAMRRSFYSRKFHVLASQAPFSVSGG